METMETKERKWTAGKPIPVKMPAGPLFREMEREIAELEEKELRFKEENSKKADRIFNFALDSVILAIILKFVLVKLINNSNSQMVAVIVFVVETIALYFSFKLFDIYAEKNDDDFKRRKLMIVLAVFIYGLLSVFTIFSFIINYLP